MMNDGYRLTDIERRLHNLLMVGTVSAVDPVNALCRVQAGKNLTAWLAWLTQRAGPDRTWWAPEVGEQVLVLSPSGETAQGVVMPSLYQTAHPAPGDRVTHHVQEYADGTRVIHDRDAKHYHVAVPAGGKITLQVGTTTLVLENGATTLTTPALTVDAETSTFTGAVTIQGALTYLGGMKGSGGSGAAAAISGDVTADGISLKNHIHTGDDGGNTSKPN